MLLLEEENKVLQTSLENSQAEIENLKAIIDDVNFKQETANTSSDGIQSELYELRGRRGNMKYFGIKESENEKNNDTELALREFMLTN